MKPRVNNDIEKFIKKYEAYDAAYQLKSDGSPTGDGNIDDSGCLAIKRLMHKFSLDGSHETDGSLNSDKIPLPIPTSILT